MVELGMRDIRAWTICTMLRKDLDRMVSTRDLLFAGAEAFRV